MIDLKYTPRCYQTMSESADAIQPCIVFLINKLTGVFDLGLLHYQPSTNKERIYILHIVGMIWVTKGTTK